MQEYNFDRPTDRQTDRPTDRQTDKRNYGIDLLRIVSMFMVVILHLLGQGGILQQIQQGRKYVVSWFVEIGAYCAVNCYALISGFVGYSEQPKEVKYSRYIMLWMQVVFYCVFITGIFCIIRPDVISKGRVVRAVLPVTFKQYWYFTAYTGVFYFAPWMNKVIRNFSKKELTELIIICVVIFSFYSTAVQIVSDPFGVSGGYSFLWLVILYIIGAYVKKYKMCKCIEKKYLIRICFLLLIFTWIWKISLTRGDDIFVSYISPTILGIAIALLLLFGQMNVNGLERKCVKFVAPGAFGVYLIHTHPLVFEYIMKGRFSGIAKLSAWMILVAVLAVALVIFVGCMFIDKLRGLIFKILRLNRLAIKMEEFGGTVYENFKRHYSKLQL